MPYQIFRLKIDNSFVWIGSAVILLWILIERPCFNHFDTSGTVTRHRLNYKYIACKGIELVDRHFLFLMQFRSLIVNLFESLAFVTVLHVQRVNFNCEFGVSWLKLIFFKKIISFLSSELWCWISDFSRNQSNTGRGWLTWVKTWFKECNTLLPSLHEHFKTNHRIIDKCILEMHNPIEM